MTDDLSLESLFITLCFSSLTFYQWMEEVRQICGPSVPVLLVGCKRDLREDAISKGRAQPGQFVEKEQGKQVAGQIGARSYHECSSLKNEGVDVSNRKGMNSMVFERFNLRVPRVKKSSDISENTLCHLLLLYQAIFEAATRASMLVRSGGANGIGALEKRGSSKGKSDVGGCKCVVL